MIGKLTGTVDSTGEDWAILDVRGVGYLVHGSSRTLSRLQTATGEVALFVDTRVREDGITLFAFQDATEQTWFRLLTQVQGVGGRVALAMLSALTPDDLARAIAAEDRKMLTIAEGVGPKLAARIVSELREKVAGTSFLPRPALPGPAAPAAPADDGPARDAVSALINLGYGRSEAFGAIAKAAQAAGDGATVESLIRAGLRELAT